MKTVMFVDLLNLFWDQHGVYSIASVLKKNNIEASYIGSRNLKKIVAEIKKTEPDVLLYSAFSATVSRYKEFDAMVKQTMDIKSVVGGAAATYGWEDFKDSTIDAICIGEGEDALADYISSGYHSNKNIFCMKDGFPEEFNPLVDLNALPFPDRSIIYDKDKLLQESPSKQFLSGRGCPYNCTYCLNHKFKDLFKGCGRIVRKKSVDYLLDEIKEVKRRYPLTNVIFNDDTFILDKKWFIEFSERFPREIGLPYTCNIRANLVDEDIVHGLSESHCRSVNWSIESGNDFMRNEVLKRNMSRDQILNAAELLNKYKIQHRIGNVIGLPGETFEQMFETLDVNIKAKSSLSLANIFVPFPGLELTKYARENGYYKGLAQDRLPKDYFTRSVLNFSEQHNKAICKLVYLFPIFVSNPYLFRNTKLRKIIMGLPRLVLRVIYEIFYTWKMSRMYVVKTPFLCKLKMGMRYLRNL